MTELITAAGSERVVPGIGSTRSLGTGKGQGSLPPSPSPYPSSVFLLHPLPPSPSFRFLPFKWMLGPSHLIRLVQRLLAAISNPRPTSILTAIPSTPSLQSSPSRKRRRKVKTKTCLLSFLPPQPVPILPLPRLHNHSSSLTHYHHIYLKYPHQQRSRTDTRSISPPMSHLRRPLPLHFPLLLIPLFYPRQPSYPTPLRAITHRPVHPRPQSTSSAQLIPLLRLPPVNIVTLIPSPLMTVSASANSEAYPPPCLPPPAFQLPVPNSP